MDSNRHAEIGANRAATEIFLGHGSDAIQRVEAFIQSGGFSPHRHDVYAIGVTLSGVQSFRYRGADRQCLPGQCHILHPDEMHDGRAAESGGFRYRIAYIDPGLIQRALGGKSLPFVADPSQQLARILDDEQVRALVDGADYLFGNEYEEALIERKSGWGSAEMLARVGVRITTLGAAGARIEQRGEPTLTVPPIPDAKPVDPTGSGDAFRSGFLAAIAWGLPLERAAQLGNLLAVHALEATGPQEYNLKPAPLAERFAAAYGDTAAAEVAAHLPA